MNDTWITILAVSAIISVGMMSGLYWAFTIAVMPGLAESDDRTFVAVMQAINRRIQNVWFLPVFLGSVVLPVATAVTLFVSNDSEATPWGVAGGLLAILPLVITVRGNIPLNTALESAGDGGDLDDPAGCTQVVRATMDAAQSLADLLLDTCIRCSHWGGGSGHLMTCRRSLSPCVDCGGVWPFQ